MITQSGLGYCSDLMYCYFVGLSCLNIHIKYSVCTFTTMKFGGSFLKRSLEVEDLRYQMTKLNKLTLHI